MEIANTGGAYLDVVNEQFVDCHIIREAPSLLAKATRFVVLRNEQMVSTYSN